ncbi:MAG: hypothetical protein AAF664_06335, partial [Planctomycetota bacterium]
MTRQDAAYGQRFDRRGPAHEFVASYAEENLVPTMAAPWDRHWIDLHRFRIGVNSTHSDVRQTVDQRSIEPVEIAANYLARLEQLARGLIFRDQMAIHLSIRTSPQRNRSNKPSRTDVGLVYDCERTAEQEFAMAWIDEIYSRSVDLRIRRNYPGRGQSAPCVTRTLRRRLSELPYLGIGVWLNERWASRDNRRRAEAIHLLVESLESVVDELQEYRAQAA